MISIEDDNKTIKNLIKKNEREINLLNPKRQVVRLFGGLLASIFLICFYYFQHSHFCTFKYEAIRINTIILSALIFVYCLWVLWQVFCTIIEAKLEEEREKNKPKDPVLQISI